MGADKFLARPGRKQANISVRMAWISFGALPYREGDLMTVRVSMLLKSRTSLTFFEACFLPIWAKDLSAPQYTILRRFKRFLHHAKRNYLSATFSNGLLSVFILWILLVFWSRDMTMYLILSTFTSSPVFLLVTTKASMFFCLVCTLPPNILTSSA